MWLVFIDAAVLFVIITLHMHIAIYEANMGHLQVILIVPACIDLLFNWLTGVAAYLHRYCWYS